MEQEKLYTSLRFSHLISYAGIGAIIRDNEDRLVSLVDTRYWTDRNGICTAVPLMRISPEIRACCAGGKNLKKPPVAAFDDQKGVKGYALPAVIFPKWTVCPSCKQLYYNPWFKQKKKLFEDPVCSKCNDKKLKQVTWCVVSRQGYLDDVPWHYVCHLESAQKCEAKGESHLQISVDRSGNEIVRCTQCGAVKKIKEVYQFGRINRPQPWLKFSDYPGFERTGGQDVEILEVNDPRVYIPKTSNALVIPPESRMESTLVDRISGNTVLLERLEGIPAGLRRKRAILLAAEEYGCAQEEMEEALAEVLAKSSRKSEDTAVVDIDYNSILHKEYEAFLTPIPDLKEEEDFVIEIKSEAWRNELSLLEKRSEPFVIGSLIDELVLVKRLRELRIFNGFMRLSQEIEQDGKIEKKKVIRPWIFGDQDWLPSIELYGEGVFFTLDKKLLSRWEDNTAVKQRTDSLRRQYKNSLSLSFYDSLPEIEPRFLLLHILSHLLIRELEVLAGFPAASLNERIYSSKSQEMAGILIYTAVPDIAGSLGGILECAKPKKFLTLLLNCFRHAAWCSLDPVCSEHEGQGPGLLNRAACHACALVPETACSYNNVFLDRNFIKGNNAGLPNLQEFVRTCLGKL